MNLSWMFRSIVCDEQHHELCIAIAGRYVKGCPLVCIVLPINWRSDRHESLSLYSVSLKTCPPKFLID